MMILFIYLIVLELQTTEKAIYRRSTKSNRNTYKQVIHVTLFFLNDTSNIFR